MQDKKVLVIDDDAQVRQMIERTFTEGGARVISAPDGSQGLRTFFEQRPDLVILDIMMPGTDGWEACRQIRLLADTPIILLTALDRDEDIIRGLDYGADEFVTKPFSPRVLLARARAALRRAAMPGTEGAAPVYDDGYLRVDLKEHRVQVEGEEVKLTPKERSLLAYLMQNSGRVRTYRQILENVWGWEYQDSVEYVHVYISHLRKKLEREPRQPAYLLSEHGLGYRFEQQN